jgi:hypothetical protein
MTTNKVWNQRLLDYIHRILFLAYQMALKPSFFLLSYPPRSFLLILPAGRFTTKTPNSRPDTEHSPL